jgi:hypothetical protein
MRFAKPWIAAALAWSACSLACANPAPLPEVQANQPFTLKQGASAQWSAGGLRVGLEAVTADSRCATGTQCVWAGDATVRVWVQRTAGAKDVRELHTAAQAAHTVVIGDLELTLVALDPQPVAGQVIDKGAYTATLLVRRNTPVGTPTETPSGPERADR